MSQDISVFYRNANNGGSRFTSQNTEQTAIAEFKGKLEGFIAGGEDFTDGKYLYGIYPYSPLNSIKDGVATITLPAYQTAAEGTFANGLFPTIARAKGVNLAFHNICGGVKFTVSRDDITSVTFKGNNDERLAGTVEVVFDEQEKPAVLEKEVENKTEITVYAPNGNTFEVGKEYYIIALPIKLASGFSLTFRTSEMKEGVYVSNKAVEIKRSIFGVVNQADKEIATWTDNTSVGGGDNSGIYLGIEGFNKSLMKYPIILLNSSIKAGFDGFINALTNNDNHTALTYAVDNAITTLQSGFYPSDLYNASIVTFTDGIDNYSRILRPEFSMNDYLDYVNDRIMQEKVSGVPITAYSIGLESAGVNMDSFENTLAKLSSSSENKFRAKNMDEVKKKFKEIADKISESSTQQTVTVQIAGGLDNGMRIRFTFDIPKSSSMPSSKADNSQVYIEGTYYMNSLDDIYIDNINCKGLTFSHGDKVKGTFDGENVNFTFEGLETDSKKIIDKEMLLEWWGTPWQFDYEREPGESANVVLTKRSVAIILVLDCTSSLETLFADLKTNAQDFINTLYAYTNPDSGSEDDNTLTPNNLSRTPIDLSLAVSKDGVRYYMTKEQYNQLGDVEGYGYSIDGVTVLSAAGNFIVALKNANENATIYYDAWQLLYPQSNMPTYDQALIMSARLSEINTALTAFGGSRLSTGSSGYSGYYDDTWVYKAESSYCYCLYTGGGTVGYNTSSSYAHYFRPVITLDGDLTSFCKDHLKLSVIKDGQRKLISLEEYQSSGVPAGYTKEGVYVKFPNLDGFIVELENANTSTVNYSSAVSLYGDFLPTYNQGIAMSANLNSINSALRSFGGSTLNTGCSSYSGYYDDTWIISGESSYYYCLCTSGGTVSYNTGSSYNHYVRRVISCGDITDEPASGEETTGEN